jgi:hypothetical protein
MSAGKTNLYTCTSCGGRVTTIDREDGVTPFMIGCRATEGCHGMMQSSFYRVPPDAPPPTYEWYRPTEKEARRLGPSMLEHVKQGGLNIRPVIHALQQ